MGWFLSNNKTKTKKKTKRSTSADPKWDPHRTLLGVKFAGFAGLALAVALGWHFGTTRLEAYANQHHAKPIHADDIRFTDKPTSMSPDKVNELRAKIAMAIDPEPLNRDGLIKAAELLRNEYKTVRTVRQVRRTSQGTIEVDLDFRKPAALVLMINPADNMPATDGYHVIDDMGFYMDGPKYLADLRNPDLPKIVGVSSNDRPRDEDGQHRWQSEQIDAALALIKILRETPMIDLIESISVNAIDGRERTRLIINTLVPTAAGENVPCQIVWGLPPGQERSIEPDADRKIAALATVISASQYRMGHWQQVWINTGDIRPVQTITPEPDNR